MYMYMYMCMHIYVYLYVCIADLKLLAHKVLSTAIYIRTYVHTYNVESDMGNTAVLSHYDSVIYGRIKLICLFIYSVMTFPLCLMLNVMTLKLGLFLQNTLSYPQKVRKCLSVIILIRKNKCECF